MKARTSLSLLLGGAPRRGIGLRLGRRRRRRRPRPAKRGDATGAPRHVLHALRRRHADRRRQPGQPALLGADADQEAEPRQARRRSGARTSRPSSRRPTTSVSRRRRSWPTGSSTSTRPNGEVIAVDGKTGEANWKWETDGLRTTGTRRGVSVGDGKVYTLADGNRVVALDKDTGEEVWVVQPVGAERRGPRAGRKGRDRVPRRRGLRAHDRRRPRRGRRARTRATAAYLWHFFGGPDRGIVFTDVDGNSVDAGATWGPVLPDGTECNLEGGATPWMHGAVDPELGMYYMSFGNARSCTRSQNGSLRPGDNLFASTMVAVDFKTGEYKWHYQSIRHDVWDMDNVHPPTLADIEVDGEERKVVFYGSKSGHQFVLDRTNGQPVLPVDRQADDPGLATAPRPRRSRSRRTGCCPSASSGRRSTRRTSRVTRGAPCRTTTATNPTRTATWSSTRTATSPRTSRS